jgi:CubicO group peptidase (beta-lactamase class C family)
MTKKTLLTALALICLLVGCGQSAVSPTPEPTSTTPLTATNVPTPEPTPTTSPTATNVPTPEPIPTTSPTATIVPATTTQDADPALDAALNDLVERGRFSGAVLIARDGEVLLNKGYGFADREAELPNTPQTRFRIASITKQFTAMAILMLEAQGKLDVQDAICDYVPDCPEEWKPVTIHHLLTHTSGLPEFRTLFASYKSTEPFSPERMMAQAKELRMSFQPGEKFAYEYVNYLTLGYIIEQVSGQTYEAFLQEHIFDPLEMQDSGYEHNGDDLAVGYLSSSIKAPDVDTSYYFSTGALFSTVEDLYRWDQALYTERLVPSEYLAKMFTEHVETGTQTVTGGEMSYGYGWYISDDFGHKMISHGGIADGFASGIARYPDDRVTIIWLANQQNVEHQETHILIARKVFGDE